MLATFNKYQIALNRVTSNFNNWKYDINLNKQ